MNTNVSDCFVFIRIQFYSFVLIRVLPKSRFPSHAVYNPCVHPHNPFNPLIMPLIP